MIDTKGQGIRRFDTLLIAVQACVHLSSLSSPGHGIPEPFNVFFNSSICRGEVHACKMNKKNNSAPIISVIEDPIEWT